jgi:hypothetical protein
MVQKRYSPPWHFLFFLFLAGCYIEPEYVGNNPEIGYRPVYGSAAESAVAFMEPRQVDHPGKIYVYGKYLLVNEQKKGIHVFDNINPASPLNIGFLQLLGNTDMAIKDDILYADHLGNLVALTTNDFQTIEEEGRLPLRNWNLGIPPPRGFNFECVDPDKGIVVSWVTTSETKNLKCYAIQ